MGGKKSIWQSNIPIYKFFLTQTHHFKVEIISDTTDSLNLQSAGKCTHT